MHYYNVILTRITSCHENLRTEEVSGITPKLPEVGKHFEMVAPTLNPDFEGSVRYVGTSPVQSIEILGDKTLLRTMNSVYEFKILKE